MPKGKDNSSKKGGLPRFVIELFFFAGSFLWFWLHRRATLTCTVCTIRKSVEMGYICWRFYMTYDLHQIKVAQADNQPSHRAILLPAYPSREVIVDDDLLLFSGALTWI